jgi:hypothetical protein
LALQFSSHYVFPIRFPSDRIGGDVFPDFLQFVMVASDVFVIIALRIRWNGAGTAACPSVGLGNSAGFNNDDSVNMVRQNHKRVDLTIGIVVCHLYPNRLHHLSYIIQIHFTFDDLAEQMAVARARRW